MANEEKIMNEYFSFMNEIGMNEKCMFHGRNGCMMKVFPCEGTYLYEACYNHLVSDFQLVQDREIEGNMFAEFYNKYIVTLLYTPCENELRVTVSESDSIPHTLPEPCTGETGTTFFAFENDHTIIDCGMCLLVQCPDNSFFVVDSGHYFQFNDNDRLHRFMRERTPEGQKIVINGWFITHAHTDHICKLIDFLEYNTDDVMIEGFYHNLLSSDHADHEDNHEEGEISDRLFKALDDYNAPVYILHAGMRFYVRNLCFDVLSTHEDITPEHIADYNDSTAVLKMTAEGSSVLITGDAAVLASERLERRFPETLKSDVVQIAHHGHTGLSAHCYELISADTAVFPVTRIMFEADMKRMPADIKAVEIAGQHFVTGDGTVCIPLPYDRKTVYKLPDETVEDFEKIKRIWRYVYPKEYKDYIYDTFLKNGGSPEKLVLPSSRYGWIEPKPKIDED